MRLKLALVYFRDPHAPRDGMDLIRWHELSHALWLLGHEVDMVSPVATTTRIGPGLHIRRLSEVRDWDRYDAVKTRSHRDILSVPDHRLLISRIGRVVNGDTPSHQWALREERMLCQRLVHARAKAVVFTCDEAIARWREIFPDGPELLVIPTGCPADVPEPGTNPLPAGRNVVFVGSLTSSRFVERLNALGRALVGRGIRLCFLGRNQLDLYGETDEELDLRVITHLGCVDEVGAWDYLYHADVGVTFARSTDVSDSDSSKVFYYLRSGLPAVSEQYVASNYLLQETGYGSVAPYGDIEAMRDLILHWIGRKQRAADVRGYMAVSHSWQARARALEAFILANAVDGGDR